MQRLQITTGMHQILISGQIWLDLEHKIVDHKTSDFTLIHHTANKCTDLKQFLIVHRNLTPLECHAFGLAAQFGGHILRSNVEPMMILLTQFYV